MSHFWSAVLAYVLGGLLIVAVVGFAILRSP